MNYYRPPYEYYLQGRLIIIINKLLLKNYIGISVEKL